MQDSGLVHVQTKQVTASLNLPNASHALEMMQEAFGAYRAVVARSQRCGEIQGVGPSPRMP